MKTKTISILDACRDKNLFRPYFGKDYKSFAKWRVCLKAIYGLPIRTKWGRKVFSDCTGRDPDKINPEGYQTSLLLCGRRSGKSKIAAVIGAYSAIFAGHETKLSAGESGVCSVISHTRKQGRIIRDYVRALFNQPMLTAEIIKERSADVFTLQNGTRLEILSADLRTVRGFAQVAICVDEISHMGTEGISRIRTDSQLVAALQPALATTGGKFVASTTPYGKVGWTYQTYQKHFGNDSSRDILVWHASSKYMNPTLSQKFLDRMKAEDLANFNCEFLANFREDIGQFVPLELVESLVVKGRYENLPREGITFSCFVDISGGRGDASACAIGHLNEKKKVVVDCLMHAPAPNNPFAVIATFSQRLHEWGIRRVVGDAYSAEFSSRAFQDKGIHYEKSEKTKSQIYCEVLPILCSGEIELLDNPRLVKEFASLERRTGGASGRDNITHPKGQSDDLSNSVSGLAVLCKKKRLHIGAVDI